MLFLLMILLETVVAVGAGLAVMVVGGDVSLRAVPSNVALLSAVSAVGFATVYHHRQYVVQKYDGSWDGVEPLLSKVQFKYVIRDLNS